MPRRRGAPAQAVLALAALGRVHGSPVAAASFTNRLDTMASSDASKPDIALIMADDVMRLSLGAYANNSLMKGLTPHLNALSEREGAVAVQKAYCIGAICTPSRLSVLTGRYLSAIYDQKEPVGDGGKDLVASVQFTGGPASDTFEEMKSLPKKIRQAGYLTGFYGKWHMMSTPSTAGFALTACHEYLTANMTADLTRRLEAIQKLDVMHEDESELSTHILGQPCLSHIVKRQGGFHYAAEIYADNDAVHAGGHRPECMADRAMGFVRTARAAKQPLFLWFAPTLTHSPADFMEALARHPEPCLDGVPVPEHEMTKWVERRRTTLQRLQGVHADAKAAHESFPEPHDGAAWLDTTLEPLLQELDGPNTLIIFTGDHGNARTGKGSLYEGGVQVPMLMHWTAHAGCDAWADSGHFTLLDLFPTLATIAGANVPSLADGNDRSADLFPTAHSPSRSCRSYAYTDATIDTIPPSEAVFLEVGYGRGVVVGKWKLVRVPRPKTGRKGERLEGKCISWYGDDFPTKNMVWDSYKLHPNTFCLATMLFNTEADPWELTDLTDDEPQKVEALTKLLNSHLMPNGEHV